MKKIHITEADLTGLRQDCKVRVELSEHNEFRKFVGDIAEGTVEALREDYAYIWVPCPSIGAAGGFLIGSDHLYENGTWIEGITRTEEEEEELAYELYAGGSEPDDTFNDGMHSTPHYNASGFHTRSCNNPVHDGCKTFTFAFDMPKNPEVGVWLVAAAGPNTEEAYLVAYEDLIVKEFHGKAPVLRLLHTFRGEPGPEFEHNWNDARKDCEMSSWDEHDNTLL